MQYYMYIDESGQFLDQDGSIVAGFIMRSDMEAVREHLEKEIKSLNASHSTDFDIMEDMHIAAVMMPDKAFKPAEKERSMNIPKEAREAFAWKCLDVKLMYTAKIVYVV
ncbi:MAG: hypothetical protein WCP55_14585 [Lentisphaerota bacterium]